MIRKITDIFGERKRTFSFEVFPPKTPQGMENLYRTIEVLVELSPDFVSVTYGAGGSTSKSTMDIISEVQRRFGLTCVHHLALVNQTREDLVGIIRRMKANGIRNILALRGDPPPEMGGQFKKIEGGLEFSYELIDLIKKLDGNFFSIGVAGFPEGHIECPSKELDSEYLRIKIDHGGEFVITQLLFDNEIYSEYLDRAARAGVNVRIIPGVLPITDYNKLLKFCAACGTYVCQEVHNIFAPIKDDPEQMLKEGIAYAVNQCEDLLLRGAPGLHFYCLNKVEPVRTVWNHIKHLL